MKPDLKLDLLSKRARNALEALGGAHLSLSWLRTISQRDVWIMDGYGRASSNEIRDWLKKHHDIDMPE